MQLAQLKIRGLPKLPDTGWIALKPRLSIIRTPDTERARHLIRAIQSINPPWDCRREHPFQSIPAETNTVSGYRKRIAPSKRTIALAVFNCPPSLITELGALFDPLYETDRIEVGRRLDYSRWMNFVEMASSTRWSDVSEAIDQLAEYGSGIGMTDQSIRRLIAGMKRTDRIKGESMQQLDHWLNRLRARHPSPGTIDDLIGTVNRAAYFAEARRIVEQRMPIFLTCGVDTVSALSAHSTENEDSEADRFPPVWIMDVLDESDTRATQLLDSWARDTARNQTICFINNQCRLHQGLHQYVVPDILTSAAGEPVSRLAR